MRNASLFSVTKHTKIKEKAFFRVIFTSFLGIFLCTVCLVSLTFAWFSVSVSSNKNKIETSSHSIEITVSPEINGTSLIQIDSETQFSSGEYSVLLKAKGNEKASGYVLLKTASGKTYYSGQIISGQSKTITLKLDTDELITFSYGWGTYSGNLSALGANEEIKLNTTNTADNTSDENTENEAEKNKTSVSEPKSQTNKQTSNQFGNQTDMSAQPSDENSYQKNAPTEDVTEFHTDNGTD